jgi:hypothetical protein
MISRIRPCGVRTCLAAEVLEVREVYSILHEEAQLMKRQRIIPSQDLMRDLVAAGCPLDPKMMFDGSQTIRDRVLVCQEGETETRAVELKCGGTAFIIWLHIGSGLSWPFNIWRWKLDPGWEDNEFQWLPDRSEFGPPDAHYKFPSADAPEYPREDIINHRHRLGPGGAIDGALLGFGMKAIPEAFAHGSTIHARLGLVDPIGGEIWTPVHLWVDRGVRLIHRSVPKRARRPLFERRDRVTCKKEVVIAKTRN